MPSLPKLLAVTLACGLLLTLASSGQTTRSSSSRSTSSSSRSTTAASSSNSGGGSSSSSGARQYRSNTLLEDALIQEDAETRSVVVIADEKTQQAIAKVIQDLDHPRPQVLIKVVFIEVTLDDELDAGLEGGYTFGPTKTGTIGSDFGIAQAISSGSTGGGFATFNSGNWSATLRALASRGKTKVLSRPSIMARNNQEAVIMIGQEYPMVTNSEITDTGNTINTITYKDVGIILDVTPFITANREVEMIVAPQISDISDSSVTISSAVTASIINKRSAETVVVTPNGVTTVIGGLMQTQHISTKQKIPLLGDIPVLGWPFQRTVKSDVKSELLIFMTPYIVDDNQQSLQCLTDKEANRATLARQMLTPEDVKNNLDTIRLIPEDPAPALPTSTTTKTTLINCVPVQKAVPVNPNPTPAAKGAPKSTPKPRLTAKPSPTPKPAAITAKKASPTPSPTPATK